MSGLPQTRCLAVAIATPLTPDYHPDVERLLARGKELMSLGCDGLTVFGTTGEGAEFSVEDRIETLNALIVGGIAPEQIIVSIGAMAIPDVIRLAAHATDRGVHGVLLMPPAIYRSGITEDATFRFYATIVDRLARPDLRLYLYHFPDICGVPITPTVVRRLDERYPGIVAGVKDSSGDLDFTQDLIRRFSHLSIFTGSEIHLPEILASGGRGTICGLANVMPRLMRALVDLPTAFDRRAVVPHLLRGDAVLSRRPFIPSAKAVIAEMLDDPQWRRVIPPMPDIPMIERQRIVADFAAWDSSLPAGWRSMPPRAAAGDNVIDLRRA